MKTFATNVLTQGRDLWFCNANLPAVSLVTNASLRDAPRLRAIIPHWFRVFGEQIGEMSIMLDAQPLRGRIASQQAVADSYEAVVRVLKELASEYPRLRWQVLDYGLVDDVSRVWWRRGSPVRCQAGSPIFAFAAAVLSARHRFVLRADCDMLFWNDGWLDEAIRRLDAGLSDIVSPPRFGKSPTTFSSRAALINWPSFRKKFLPMPAAKLDWIRSIHRLLHGRPTYMAFEDSFINAVNRGIIRHHILPETLGRSLHIARIIDAAAHDFPNVVRSWEEGEIPHAQVSAGWDYDPAAWSVVLDS